METTDLTFGELLKKHDDSFLVVSTLDISWIPGQLRGLRIEPTLGAQGFFSRKMKYDFLVFE